MVVNLQQLLSALKAQNPILHQIALRLGPGTPVSVLAETFQSELRINLNKLELQLDRDLRYGSNKRAK